MIDMKMGEKIKRARVQNQNVSNHQFSEKNTNTYRILYILRKSENVYIQYILGNRKSIYKSRRSKVEDFLK